VLSQPTPGSSVCSKYDPNRLKQNVTFSTSETRQQCNESTVHSYTRDTVTPHLNSAQPTEKTEHNMTTTKNKAGRKSYEFEKAMEEYRKYFTTGTKKTRTATQ